MLIAAIVLIGTRPAMAQGAKAEVFGGGSFLRRTNTFNGWNASITGNMLSWLGVTADLAGHYNSGLHVHTYTFGPRLAIPQDSGLVPFTQATFGVVQLGGHRKWQRFRCLSRRRAGLDCQGTHRRPAYAA